MAGTYTQLMQRLDRLFVHLDQADLIPHPLKRLSRRFLGVAVGLSGLLHIALIGGTLLYFHLKRETTAEIVLEPYPSHLIDMIDPSKLITSEQGGGGGGGQQPGGEPPPDPGEDILSKGTPVPVSVGIPEPIPDTRIAEEQDMATQEEMQKEVALAKDEPVDAPATIGMKGMGGAGSGDGGVGGGFGSGGGGGDGPPGTWRYDTPPNPRRLITIVQPRKLRNVDGMVKFRLLINEFGQVIDASIVESSGYRELDDLALDAIHKSTFNPATFRGRSVKAWITFGYGIRSRSR